ECPAGADRWRLHPARAQALSAFRRNREIAPSFSLPQEDALLPRSLCRPQTIKRARTFPLPCIPIRNADAESCAFRTCRKKFDMAAMRLNNFRRDSEAETGAVRARAARERLEEMLARLRGQARPVVRYIYVNM